MKLTLTPDPSPLSMERGVHPDEYSSLLPTQGRRGRDEGGVCKVVIRHG